MQWMFASFVTLGIQGQTGPLRRKYCSCSTRLRACISQLMLSFPLAAVRHLTVVNSDHCLILLSLEPHNKSDVVRRKEEPLRYEMMWETSEGLVPLIQQEWKNYQDCNSVRGMNHKLIHLQQKLRLWEQNNFGAVRRQLREQKKRLEQMRADTSRVGVSEEEKKVVEQNSTKLPRRNNVEAVFSSYVAQGRRLKKLFSSIKGQVEEELQIGLRN